MASRMDRTPSLTPMTLPPDHDRISLREHVVETEVGAYADERGTTQRLIFNIVVDVAGASRDDDVDSILSYELLVDAVAQELAAGRAELLETLAEGICARLLPHPRVARVEVRVEKPDRVSGRLGVEIARTAPRQGAAPARLDEGPAPQVFCLPEGAGDAPWFAAWRAALPEGPLVLVVEGAPVAGEDTAAQRIRFLNAEAAAWGLRAALPGAEVIASRAEMRAAFASGKRAIWAPSKMLFAARDPGAAVLGDLGRAAAWFAAEMGAAALCYVARPVPAGLSFAGPVAAWSPAP